MCNEDRETLSWLRAELDGLRKDRAVARFGPDQATIKEMIDAEILDLERQVNAILDRDPGIASAQSPPAGKPT
jgi:hypothetical protein